MTTHYGGAESFSALGNPLVEEGDVLQREYVPAVDGLQAVLQARARAGRCLCHQIAEGRIQPRRQPPHAHSTGFSGAALLRLGVP